jgi:hypothetical protein
MSLALLSGPSDNRDMTHDIKFEPRGMYLLATITGENNPETIASYMRKIVDHCDAIDCHRVLIHEKLSGPRLSTMEIFDLVSTGSEEILGSFDAIAFVDEEMGAMSDFAETVGVNRGMPIAMFTRLDKAESWIKQQVDDADSQRIFRGTNPEDMT